MECKEYPLPDESAEKRFDDMIASRQTAGHEIKVRKIGSGCAVVTAEIEIITELDFCFGDWSQSN